jgi:hypothetical protein
MRIAGGLVLSLVAGLAIAWWAFAQPVYVHRFKLILQADVAGVLRSGTSVIEVRTTRYQSRLAEASGVRHEVLGDAVFLDLGNGRNVIALLGFNPHGTRDEIGALDYIVFEAQNKSLQVTDLPALRGRARLPDHYVPTLITFSDLKDPKTAREVGQTEFEKVFGADVHFKGAWIEMTTDPVARGIDKVLLWWNRPGRPAAEAYRAWLNGDTRGASVEPETLFRREEL